MAPREDPETLPGGLRRHRGPGAMEKEKLLEEEKSKTLAGWRSSGPGSMALAAGDAAA